VTAPYPFSAVVGADDLRVALCLNAVSPAIGGVLVRGEKGTAKSTAVRGLASLLPAVAVVGGCRYACDPAAPAVDCPDGPHPLDAQRTRRSAALVELPVGATEDRVAGALDLERALGEGRRAFEPGLLARAHRGLLYVDEVNLLADAVVDLLLDAAAMGVNHVEREGVSVRHPARFQLVGTMNPEEGELRPQLLDRFGLTVEVRASRELDDRAEVVRRRLEYEADPDRFAARWTSADGDVAARIRAARARLPQVVFGDAALRAVVAACAAFDVDGMRADLVTAKAAMALAAWEGRTAVTVADVRRAALLALPHRRRRQPFEQPGIEESRLDEALEGMGDDPDPGPDPPAPSDSGPPDSPSPSDGPAEGGRDAAGPDTSPPVPAVASDDERPSGGAPPDEAGGAGDGFRGDRDTAGVAAGAEPSPGEADGRGAAREPVTLPAGASFDPVLLTVGGTGAGAAGRRSPARARTGRHVGDRAARPGGELALVATLRVAAPSQRRRGRGASGPLRVTAGDLREKVRQGREGNLVLFVVDASGSMAARRRMTAVKGAVLSLLLDAYRRRDRVGLVTFRGDGAQVALPPTTSVDLAARLLAELPTGGRTPLAAGLARAAEVVAVEAVRDPSRRPLLVVVTDGRRTAGPDPRPVAGALAARGVAAVVVDTEDGVVRLGMAGELAAALGAPWLRVEQLAAGSLAGVVRTAAARGRVA